MERVLYEVAGITFCSWKSKFERELEPSIHKVLEGVCVCVLFAIGRVNSRSSKFERFCSWKSKSELEMGARSLLLQLEE